MWSAFFARPARLYLQYSYVWLSEVHIAAFGPADVVSNFCCVCLQASSF